MHYENLFRPIVRKLLAITTKDIKRINHFTSYSVLRTWKSLNHKALFSSSVGDNHRKVLTETQTIVTGQPGGDLRLAWQTARLKVDPYYRLMRLDKPIGSWLLFWPCSWSCTLAAIEHGLPVSEYLRYMGLFLVGSFVMRGAGCTINDLWDKDIDSKVERTKDRPLVSGAVTSRSAVIFLMGQLSVGLAVLMQFNWYTVFLTASSMALVVTYPLAKRFTDYPQMFLGATFNWGALSGWSAVTGCLDVTSCVPLYLGALCWTVVYDTIYAHQDKIDDARIGIKSTALKFGPNTKVHLAAWSVGSLLGLSVAGAGLSPIYHATLALASCHIARQIYTLDIDNPSDCADKFKSNRHVGLIIFLGIVMGGYHRYIEKLRVKESKSKHLQEC